MNKKVIFLDIDGTLTEPGSNVPPDSALEAIRRARENGHYVYLCTGRSYDMMKALLVYDWDGYIASSGGYVVCGDQLIFDCPMTPEQQELVMSTLKEHGIYRTAECRDGSYTDEGFKQFLAEHADEGGNSELLRWREQIEKDLRILPMQEYQGQPIYKVVIMSPDAERIEEPERILSGEFAVVTQEPGAGGFVNGEVVNLQFDKGQAVRRVCEYLQIPIEDSIGYGDSMSDLEMIETVGLSICMENGSRALKELSDKICPSVSDDGLARSFAELGLI